MGWGRIGTMRWTRALQPLPYPADYGVTPTKVVAFVGQSNTFGLGTNKASVGLAAVPSIFGTYSNALMADPPVFKTEGRVQMDDRKQYISTSYPLNSWGPDLAVANYLAANSSDRWEFCTRAIDGMGLEDHLLNPLWPTAGPPMLDQTLDFIEGIVNACSGYLHTVVYGQGEYDAVASPDSTNYAANLVTLRAAIRARFGSQVQLIVVRLSSNYANNTSAVIRAAQEGLQNQGTDVVIIPVDSEAFRDTAHFTDQGYKNLGDRIGQDILTPRPSQRWWGAGVPGTKTSTGTLTPTVPTSGRLGLLVIAGIGNTAYSPPAGWTLVANIHDDLVLTSARLQVYWRSLQPGDTVSIADLPADDAATAFVLVFEGCSLSSPIQVVTSATQTTASTTFTAPSATATGAGLAVVIGAHELDFAGARASGWPTDWTEQVDYSHTGASGSGIFVATKPVTAGATGTIGATLAAASTWAAATVVLNPS